MDEIRRRETQGWGRKGRLILGWILIAFAVWLLGYSTYLLLTGRFGQNAQLPISCALLFMGGSTLLRSKPNDSPKGPK
jgi:hypothetical protein